MNMRFGIGYDVHCLVEGRPLILGGVEIPFDRGLEGHSDADVLAHAIADALLGAVASGDIGHHFPNTDESIRGISSLDILSRVVEILAEEGWEPGNIDSSLIAEAPKIKIHIPAMREKLAKAIGIDGSLIGIKATTNEGMGFAGRGEGIAAYAVASVVRKGSKSS